MYCTYTRKQQILFIIKVTILSPEYSNEVLFLKFFLKSRSSEELAVFSLGGWQRGSSTSCPPIFATEVKNYECICI